MTTPVTTFYTSPTHALKHQDFTLQTYLTWPDQVLEQRHDYIQTIFPLPEPSAFNFHAPQITKPDYHAFRSTTTLKQNLQSAFDRICKFYGLVPTRNPETGALQSLGSADSLGTTSRHYWLTSFGHNHLRVTRIIRSLRVLGLADEARLFYDKLLAVDDEVGGVVGGQSKKFWKRAMELPLSNPRDDRDDECEWLKGVDEGT